MIKKGLNSKLAEVGKIKIGGKGETRKDKNGKPYQLPIRYDHFVVTTTEKDPKTGNFKPDENLMSILGDKPKEIKICFLFDDIDMNFFTSFAFYQGAKCICRGDGETAERFMVESGKPKTCQLLDTDELGDSVQAGETRKIICDPDTCPFMQPDAKGVTKCKPSGILSCLIPESGNISGVYRFRTHSWNTISNILGSLEHLKKLTLGVLTGIPMKLQMIKKATEEHGNVNVVTIDFDGESYQEMRNQALLEMKNRTDHGVNMRMIENKAKKAGFLVDTDNAEDVEIEFYKTVSKEEIIEEEKSKPITDRAAAIIGDPVETAPAELVIEEVAEVEKEEEVPEVEEEPINGELNLDIF
jgi:hypothetical protein